MHRFGIACGSLLLAFTALATTSSSIAQDATEAPDGSAQAQSERFFTVGISVTCRYGLAG
ncbi:MAG: hypothetical protein AAF581_09935 [Planctomycetota bacterium]